MADLPVSLAAGRGVQLVADEAAVTSDREEPAHFEPKVRKREKARMASPA